MNRGGSLSPQNQHQKYTGELKLGHVEASGKGGLMSCSKKG